MQEIQTLQLCLLHVRLHNMSEGVRHGCEAANHIVHEHILFQRSAIHWVMQLIANHAWKCCQCESPEASHSHCIYVHC